MSVLAELSNGLGEAVKSAGVGVVQVDARRRLPATGFVWSADGVIVTAHHVLRNDQPTVGLPDGSRVEATLVGRDPGTDLAVLKVAEEGLTPLARANPDDIAVGHLVLALGRPGQTVQATLGIVSALGQSWRTGRGGEIDRYLQTDVVMYPGFSGGPLIDVNGQLLGLNTSALVSGISVALPTSTIERVVTALMTHGHMRRGFLGVSTQKVQLPAALAESMQQKSGLLIVMVEPDSPADQGGLLLGDTIVELDGQRVTNHDALMGLLTGDRVGKPVNVQVVRGGVVTKLTVSIGERA